MHEFSIIQNILDTVIQVAAENHLKKVTKITVKMGRLRQVMPDFLQFAFEHSTAGTVAEGAKLIIVDVPVKIFCQACQKEFTLTEVDYRCPDCQSIDIKIIEGKEILLEKIEGE